MKQSTFKLEAEKPTKRARKKTRRKEIYSNWRIAIRPPTFNMRWSFFS